MVTICRPSRRMAGSSIQKPKFSKGCKGANYIAKERGLMK